jgi:tetratricopeptide (TPR) repeat protein
MRAALEWALEGEDAETGLRLAATLGQFWLMRGHLLPEGIAWLERAVARTEASEPTAIRAKAYRRLGHLTCIQGDRAAARSACEKSLALFQELGNKDGMAQSLIMLGDIVAFQGDDVSARSLYAAARSACEESLVILHERGDKWRLARSLNTLGELVRTEGDYAAARSFYEQSLTLRRELGDEWGVANSLINLGYVACSQGDYRHAATLIGECLPLCQKPGDKRGISYCLALLARVTGDTGQPERAARLFGAAEALREAIHVRLEYVDRIEEDRNIDAVRTQLDEAAFAAAWAEGRAMTLEQAVDYALATNPE